MKIILLGTAAFLALTFGGAFAATPAKSGLKLGIGGYITGQGAYVDQDDDAGEPGFGVRKFDILQHSEVHFTGETTFDNGLTTGAEIVLKGEPSDEQIQESYIYMSGNWGRVEVGSNYSAAYQMTVAAPGVDAQNYDGPDPDFILVDPGTNTASEGYVPFYQSGDLLAEKVTYYTPRFNGFQGGLSYTPDASRNSVINGNVSQSITGNTGNGGSVGKGPATAGLGNDTDPGRQSDRVEAGLNYQGRLYGFGVLAGATYATARSEGAFAPGAFAGEENEQAWNAGLQLSYENFTFGGGYYWDDNGARALNGLGAEIGDNETSTVYAGMNYGLGPWSVGASYLTTQVDASPDAAPAIPGVGFTGVAAENELDRWILGGNYEVASGVKFTSTLQFHEYDQSGPGATAAGDNDATVVTLGTTVNF